VTLERRRGLSAPGVAALALMAAAAVACGDGSLGPAPDAGPLDAGPCGSPRSGPAAGRLVCPAPVTVPCAGVRTPAPVDGVTDVTLAEDACGDDEVVSTVSTLPAAGLRPGTTPVEVTAVTRRGGLLSCETEVRVVDEHGADVGVGAVGELLVRGASSADGYWNQRDKTRSTFEGHWTRTGDKYELTAEGRYVYCGRTDDMFKSGGNWVSPFEVESAIISHDKVLEAAVIPHTDDRGNLKPKAYVVLKDGVEPSSALSEELQQFVQQNLENWKYPRWIEFLEGLPKTATGKIQRFKLRDMDES